MGCAPRWPQLDGTSARRLKRCVGSQAPAGLAQASISSSGRYTISVRVMETSERDFGVVARSGYGHSNAP
jgi:hypothetical protein